MKLKFLFAFFIVFTYISNTHAQVGINTESPDPSSILDIVSTDKGVYLPRMTTTQKQAIQDPKAGLLVFDTSLKCVSEYTDNTWVCLSVPKEVRWFYMPSIPIPVDSISATAVKTLNLYNEYKSQFLGTNADSFKASNNAPSSIPYFPQANELYYYVTFYSKDVFEIVEISDTGVMQYKVIGEPQDDTLLNVVFVFK